MGLLYVYLYLYFYFYFYLYLYMFPAQFTKPINQHFGVNPTTAKGDTKRMCCKYGMLRDRVLLLLARATCSTEIIS